MSWIFPPEGCDGIPVNMDRAKYYLAGLSERNSGARIFTITFYFDGEDWSTWTFETKEARDTALKEINDTLADDPLKAIARELDFISRSAVLS